MGFGGYDEVGHLVLVQSKMFDFTIFSATSQPRSGSEGMKKAE